MIDIIVKKYDQKLLIYLGILAALGTVMLYSASWYESFSSTNGKIGIAEKSFKEADGGCSFFFFGFLIIDYRKLKSIALHLVIFSIILLLATKLLYSRKGYSWYKPARWLSSFIFFKPLT